MHLELLYRLSLPISVISCTFDVQALLSRFSRFIALPLCRFVASDISSVVFVTPPSSCIVAVSDATTVTKLSAASVGFSSDAVGIVVVPGLDAADSTSTTVATYGYD